MDYDWLNEEGLVMTDSQLCSSDITARDDCREVLGFAEYYYRKVNQTPEIYIPLQVFGVCIVGISVIVVLLRIYRKNKYVKNIRRRFTKENQ